jgi:hypothetical protein
VEKVYVAQDPAHAEKPVDAPWNIRGQITDGDFIYVMSGDLMSKEGYVKAILKDSNIIVAQTRRDAGRPPMFSGHGDLQVNIYLIYFLYAYRRAECIHRLICVNICLRLGSTFRLG